MTAPVPEPALWLEDRYDRAVRLLSIREGILRQMSTADLYRAADLRRHLDTTTAALRRLGVTE